MNPVRRAVLFAAGRGHRLGALTESTPKPLIQVGGQPVLHRVIEGLAGAGVTAVAVVTGYRAADLEAATGDGARWGIALRYFRQEQLDGTARALLLARDFLNDDRFFAGWGDVVVEQANYASLLDAARHAESVIAVNEVEDPASGGAVYVDDAMRVTRIVEKPPPGSSTTRWNNAGLAVLPPAIWAAIGLLERSSRGEYELPQAVANLVAGGHPVRAVPVEGPWFDIGTAENLAAARRHFGG